MDTASLLLPTPRPPRCGPAASPGPQPSPGGLPLRPRRPPRDALGHPFRPARKRPRSPGPLTPPQQTRPLRPLLIAGHVHYRPPRARIQAPQGRELSSVLSPICPQTEDGDPSPQHVCTHTVSSVRITFPRPPHFLASSFFSFQTARASLPPGSPPGPPLPGPVVSPAASPHHPESAAAASVPQPGRHLSGAWLSLEKAFCMDAPPTPRGAHVWAGARGAPLPPGGHAPHLPTTAVAGNTAPRSEAGTRGPTPDAPVPAPARGRGRTATRGRCLCSSGP